MPFFISQIISVWNGKLIHVACDKSIFASLIKPGHFAQSWQCSEAGADDASLWSGVTEPETGLEMSQQMMENLLLGVGSQLKNEAFLMGISSRLQAALENMLVSINDSTNQVSRSFYFSYSNTLYSYSKLLMNVENVTLVPIQVTF